MVGVDFSSLVLKPCQDTFGLNVIVTPYASRPLDLTPYSARGIWKSKDVIVETAAGYHSTIQPTLGIRLSEWATSPQRDDLVEIAAQLGASSDIVGAWLVADSTPDGQGKCDLILKRKTGAT